MYWKTTTTILMLENHLSSLDPITNQHLFKNKMYSCNSTEYLHLPSVTYMLIFTLTSPTQGMHGGNIHCLDSVKCQQNISNISELCCTRLKTIRFQRRKNQDAIKEKKLEPFSEQNLFFFLV